MVYNGVDAAMFSDEKDDEMKQALGIPVSSFVIGHTGRFDEKKNHQAVWIWQYVPVQPGMIVM